MLTLIISAIVAFIFAGLAYWVISLIPMPSPFPEIIRVLVIVAVAYYLISIFFGPGSSIHYLR